MEVKLFTNEIIVNIKNILKWNRNISDISSIDNNQFIILRKGAALNKQEIISVYDNNNIVSYLFTTGIIEYRVDWSINPGSIEIGDVEPNQFLATSIEA